MLCHGEVIEIDDLPEEVRRSTALDSTTVADVALSAGLGTLSQTKEEAEAERIRSAAAEQQQPGLRRRRTGCLPHDPAQEAPPLRPHGGLARGREA
jgi:hypothetical protein